MEQQQMQYSRREFLRKGALAAGLSLTGGISSLLEGCSRSDTRKSVYDGNIGEHTIVYRQGEGANPDIMEVYRGNELIMVIEDFNHNGIIGDHPRDKVALSSQSEIVEYSGDFIVRYHSPENEVALSSKLLKDYSGIAEYSGDFIVRYHSTKGELPSCASMEIPLSAEGCESATKVLNNITEFYQRMKSEIEDKNQLNQNVIGGLI